MLKKHLCVIITLLACVLGFPSFSVSAEDVVLSNEELSSSMYDELISYYGLTGDTGEDIVYYIYGRKNGGTGNPRSSLWVGAYSYHCSYDLQTGSYSFSKGTFAIQLYESYVGRSELGSAYWYEASSSQLAFISGWSDNIRISEIYPNNNWTQTQSVTFEEFGSSLAPEPSEPSSTDAPLFQLPDSWLNGGETLPSVEDPTFPTSFDPDEAFGYIEDYTVEIDEGTKSGIGFFWAVLTGVIGALGIWDYVFFALLMGLFAWVLRGVF